MATATTVVEPTLAFDEQSHTYMLNGVAVPSVTQVLGRAGLIDDQWYTPEATHRGTYVHAMTSAYDKGVLDLDKIDDGYLGYLRAWKELLGQSLWQIRSIESRLSCEPYRYAGSLDRVVINHGALTLVDIKTGTKARWHRLQTAAYVHCLRRVCRRCCVYLRKDGTFKVETHDLNYRRDLDVFLAALTINNWKGNG